MVAPAMILRNIGPPWTCGLCDARPTESDADYADYADYADSGGFVTLKALP